MHAIARVATMTAVLVWTVLPASGQQTILGNKFSLAEKPGFPITRKITLKSTEADSLDTLTGDPMTNGATVQIIVNGATSTTQTIALPPGERWRRSPSDPTVPAVAWKYREIRRLGFVSPVTTFTIAQKTSPGTFKLAATLAGKYVPLDIAAPNPGTYAGIVVTLGGGGTYCTNFGGTAGGSIIRNDNRLFRVSHPQSEGTCPSGTATCGDGVIQTPFETCDVSNDAACPGLCGANGLPCLCPYCGDGAIDPGEACDRPNVGSCTEGCSFQCTCTTCGNGVIEHPVEDCEASSDCFEGTCPAPGEPLQCQCPYCGDGLVNLPAEQCDGVDDAACPGACIDNDCLCAVCGNNVVEGPEQCDGTDDGACPGLCDGTCHCP
ncbi:MAG TPA: hypothetical protein VMS22_13410 [Candidatus Eisenbacteria bacterium]|nr:hypothetical protein [Candidatus Eisenbacteria bacterium]